MGLQSYQGSGTTYLNVANGKLVQQHKEPNATTSERVNKVGKVVHEQKHDMLIGKLTGLETKEDNYGKRWLFNVQDDEGVKFQVQMPYSGRYSTSLLKALPNIDLSEDVKIFPWEMQDKNDAAKKISGITLYQKDAKESWSKILPAYTRDEPNGLPEMKKLKVKGKDTWDDTDMCSFLEDAAKSQFLAFYGKKHETKKEASGQKQVIGDDEAGF